MRTKRRTEFNHGIKEIMIFSSDKESQSLPSSAGHANH